VSLECVSTAAPNPSGNWKTLISSSKHGHDQKTHRRTIMIMIRRPLVLRPSHIQRAIINTRYGDPTLLCHLRRMSSHRPFASTVSDDTLDRLYPIPATAGACGLPGPTHESTLAVLEVLRDDFRRHHTFVNNLGFHKRVAISPSDRLHRLDHSTNRHLLPATPLITYWQYMHSVPRRSSLRTLTMKRTFRSCCPFQ
jgi:hypothetical protein